MTLENKGSVKAQLSSQVAKECGSTVVTYTSVCTNGGPNETGQVWQYSPSPQEGKLRDEVGQIELMVEPNNSDILENGDNICVAPWGDPIICEDGRSGQYLVGITQTG